MGGARIGRMNASFPFARLTCQRERLTLRCLGRFEFAQHDVVSLTRQGVVPVLSSGIRINHNRADYPQNMVFWCLGNADRVLRELGTTGFVPSGAARAWPKGRAFRWSAMLAAIVIWNLLFLVDLGFPPTLGRHALGLGAFTAMLLGALFATLIKCSSRVQRWVLNPGHSVGAVRPLLTFMQLLLFLMLSGFAITHFGS
jgi:hypothetical protein